MDGILRSGSYVCISEDVWEVYHVSCPAIIHHNYAPPPPPIVMFMLKWVGNMIHTSPSCFLNLFAFYYLEKLTLKNIQSFNLCSKYKKKLLRQKIAMYTTIHCGYESTVIPIDISNPCSE